MFAMPLTAKPPAIILKAQPLRARKTIRLPCLRFCLSAPLRRQADAGNRHAPTCRAPPLLPSPLFPRDCSEQGRNFNNKRLHKQPFRGIERPSFGAALTPGQ